MREIIFRGKSLVTKEWVFGDLFQHGEQRFIMTGGHNIEVAPESVGQFTGLTDKNGVKIFEGDIVKYHDSLHEVVFCDINGCAFYGIKMPDRNEIWNFDGITCGNKMEVIGNIYDGYDGELKT